MKVNKITPFLGLYRKIFPDFFRIFIKKIFKFFYYKYRFFKLKFFLKLSNKNVNLILGAALTSQRGWFSTNEEWFDIVKKKDWDKLFTTKNNKSSKRIKRVLAEHVFEHLSLEEMRIALRLIYEHMVVGGSLRIAVPDGNNPNKDYREHCGINGIGADAADHKQFIKFEMLRDEVENIGFESKLMEGFTNKKELISIKLNYELGRVLRSRNNKIDIESKLGWGFHDAKTSLIVDCFKV